MASGSGRAKGPSRIPATKVITAATMTGTSVNTGAVVDCSGLSLISFHFVWTGTPTGTISIEVSGDYDPTNPTAATWAPLDSTAFSPAITSPAGAAGNTYVELSGLGSQRIRPKYTNTSSTGVLDCTVNGKPR